MAPSGETVYVTDKERTLIDIVVRPAYAGGIEWVASPLRQVIDRYSAWEDAGCNAKRLGDSPKELSNGRVQGFGECVHGREGQVLFTALDRPDVGPMQTADSGELFL